MSSDEPAPAEVAPRRSRLRFSLLALLVFVALICLALAWLVQPDRVVATALFQVLSTKPSITSGKTTESFSSASFEILKNTQVALLRSDFVLQSAIRDPAIAGLPVLRNQTDPIVWLQQHLEAEFPQNSEILSIKLRGVKSHAGDLAAIVNAVADAYKREVLSTERAQRLMERDLLEHSLQDLNSEIKHKYEDFLEIAKGAGNAGGGDRDVQQQLDIKRIDRIDAELMRLEGDQLKAETGGQDSKFIKQRMEQLRKREKALEKELAVRSAKSVDLITRRRELDQLQRVADDLSRQLEILDIDAESPSQIRQIQTAIVTDDK